VSVDVGAYLVLDSTYTTTDVSNGELLHGIWDYTMDQPHEVIICMHTPSSDPVTVCPALPLHPRDALHQRGTFNASNKHYTNMPGFAIETSLGILNVPLSAGTANDSYIVGVDVTDGMPQTLLGNYGILYNISLYIASLDEKNMSFVVVPLGGEWGGAIETQPGITPGGVFLLPLGSQTIAADTQG
jgi:hypothetical protein